MSKKHLRGIRRHFRAHQQRAAQPVELNISRITTYRIDYQRLGVHPWYDHQKPPVRFRQLWLARLVADFYCWQTQLRQRYSSFYLAVWLHEPRFGQSELVAAVADRQRHYETLFGDDQAFRTVPPRALPPEYSAIPGVSGLHWTAYADIEALLPEEFAERGAWALNRPHWECKTLEGEPYFAIQIGWIWVGQCLTGPVVAENN